MAALFVALALFSRYLELKQRPAPEPVACTQEAKLCPDGSYVGRTGPNCDFQECPGVEKEELRVGNGFDSAGLKTYKNELFSYEIKYPDGFIIVDKPTNPDAKILYSAKEPNGFFSLFISELRFRKGHEIDRFVYNYYPFDDASFADGINIKDQQLINNITVYPYVLVSSGSHTYFFSY